MRPTRQYRDALKEAQRHHADSKTYSGMLLRPHKPFLSGLIERLGICSALDYGCGKGEQYRWVDPRDGRTIEEAWGFEVRKFDPAFPPYAAEPQGRFDLVICTHTLSLIPRPDLEWVTRRLFEHATKAVFVAEKIGERKKVVASPQDRPIGWDARRWIGWIGTVAADHPEITAVLSVREIEGEAKITTRHRWHGGTYQGGERARPED